MNQHGFTSCKKTSGFSLLQSFWIQKVTGLTGPRKFHLPQLFQFHQALFGPGKCHRTIVHHAPPARFVGHQETKMAREKKTSLVCKSSNRQNIIIIIIIIEEEKRNIGYLVTACMIRNPGSHIWSRRCHFLRSNSHDPYFIGKLGNVSLIIRSS